MAASYRNDTGARKRGRVFGASAPRPEKVGTSTGVAPLGLVAIGNMSERMVIGEKALLTRQLNLVEPIPVAEPRPPYAADTQLVGVLSRAVGGHQQGAPVDVGVAGQPSGDLIESAVGDERSEITADLLIYLCGGPEARCEDHCVRVLCQAVGYPRDVAHAGEQK
jgi:hypothetical protein